VGLDIVGPLTAIPNGNKYLFVLVNYFTKWVEAKATKTIDTNDVIEFQKRRLFETWSPRSNNHG